MSDAMGHNLAIRKQLGPYLLFLSYFVLAGGQGTQAMVRSPSLLQEQQIKPATQNPEPATLQLGTPVAREIGPGQKHSYQTTLVQGQYLRVEIKQLGIDVRASLIQPNGTAIPVLSMFVRAPAVMFERVVDATGIYRIDLFTRAKAASGRYEILLADIHAATKSDLELEQARELVDQAMDDLRNDKSSEAIPLWKQALEIRERNLGPDNLEVAETLLSLGTSYQNVGDYVTTEALFRRALKIKEKLFGPETPGVADIYRSLGDLYELKGDYAQAEESLQKAVAIFERTRQMDSINASFALQLLGDIAYARNDYAQSEAYYRRSIGILEKLLGPNNYHLVDSYVLLGRVAYDTGDYVKTLAMFQKALSLTEASLGPRDLNVAAQLDNLGMLYTTTGDYVKAEECYQRALEIHTQHGMTDDKAQETPLGLARLSAARGQLSEAVNFQTQATEIEERFVGLHLALGSEREKLALLENLSWGSSRNISFHANLAPSDPHARELAINTILRHKGRVQDVMSAALATLRQRLRPEDQALIDQLNEKGSELADLVLSGPGKSSSSEYQAQVKKLEEQRGNLEAEISRRTAGFYQRSESITVAAIQPMIPPNAALIEFAVYRPFNPKAPDNRTAYGEPRYIAYVIPPQGEIKWHDLGGAKEIEAQVLNFREALRDPLHKDVQNRARVVDELVMRPLRDAAGAATQLLISPDGALNLIPFAALVDEQGHYLVERYAFNYLTSGRDLLRLQVRRESKTAPVVFADPAFGDPAMIATKGNGDGRAGTGRSQIDYSQIFFGPLPGVSDEVRALKQLLPQATFLTREKATKTALNQLKAPAILHIATHGFFLENTGDKKTNSQTQDQTRLGKWVARVQNPLLRSGLALAGANQARNGNNDGVLTAFEATGLDLWGTKLVVLSACDTGLGEVKSGDGVYGLRRAFVIAGTESLMMSLWPVSDLSTRSLMIDYYKGLVQNEGRSEALRKVQLQMLRTKTHNHPYYWASFIQTGEWANLQGKR